MRSFLPRFLGLVSFSVIGGCSLGSALAGDRMDDLRSEAMGHYRDGDYHTFVAQMEAVTSRSDDDVDDYNLACGYALDGQLDEALATLSALVARGVSMDLVEDPDFLPLRTRPEFYQLVARTAFYEEADRRLEPVRDMAMERYYDTERYAAFVEVMENVSKYSNSDVDLYNLACGYALNGQRDEAIATLERLAERGSDFGAADDSDFENLRSDPRFHAVLVRLAG